MRITRLQLRDLRQHRDLDLALHPGLTVVRGPNEAGKTTIQRALELALFRKVNSATAELDGLRPWQAGDDARPCVRLEFQQEELDEVRTGSVEKEFRGAKGRVTLEYGDETTTDPARADELLAELTGIPNEKFFQSTASVRHHELADLDRDEAALRDRLQASISGGDRGTSRAKKKLDEALRALRARGDKNPGRLKVAEQVVAQAEAAVAAGEQALAALERDRDALVQARERRAAVEADLAERRAMLEKARQAERLSAEREVARERFERYRQAVSVSEEVGRLQASHPSSEALPVLRQLVDRLRKLETSIRELRAQLGDEAEVEYEVKIPTATWRPTAVVAMVLSLAGVAAVALGVFGLLGGTRLDQPVGLGLVAGGTVVAYIAIRQQRASSDVRRQQQLRDDQIARRLRGRSQLQQELREKEADFEAQLEALSLADLPAAEDLLAREEAHVQQIEKLDAQLEGLVGREPVETLPGLRDAAALEIEQKSAALEALGPIAREPRARERLEVEVREAETGLERARDDEAAARARVAANTVDAEQVAGETERLAGWREQLAALQRRARIYEQTLEAIERAEQATMRTATRYLEKRMRGDLELISGGRYRRVQVDDRTLDIRVWAPERRDWVDVRALSQGTLDQVYLAARLGLVRLVTEDRRPPLVFDDPFVTFDGPRAARAMTLLRKLVADFQVIYLTCSDRYDELADAVVELPGPVAVDDVPADDLEAVTADARPAAS
ncbi:MAG TPA: AAA family ATPase [Candidatus Limnocylindrales bacterium]